MEGPVSLKEFLLWRTTRDFLSFPLPFEPSSPNVHFFTSLYNHSPISSSSSVSSSSSRPIAFPLSLSLRVCFTLLGRILLLLPSGRASTRPWNRGDLDARIKKRRQKNFEWLMTATCAGVASILLRASSPRCWTRGSRVALSHRERTHSIDFVFVVFHAATAGYSIRWLRPRHRSIESEPCVPRRGFTSVAYVFDANLAWRCRRLVHEYSRFCFVTDLKNPTLTLQLRANKL